jgi:hypothetical protein
MTANVTGSERQLEGIAMAKRQSSYKGGKARLDRQRVKTLSDSGLGPRHSPRTGHRLCVGVRRPRSVIEPAFVRPRNRPA